MRKITLKPAFLLLSFVLLACHISGCSNLEEPAVSEQEQQNAGEPAASTQEQQDTEEPVASTQEQQNAEQKEMEQQEMSKSGKEDYIVENIAKELYEKGVDGFFIDNCDVYYQYQTAEIYDGLVNIIERLNEYDIDIIINGGNDFVSQLILDGKSGLIDGVNQECVFSSIKDYDNDVFAKQDKDETEYFNQYLDMAKIAGLDVYLLEYTTDPELVKEVESYCSREGFRYYISCSVGLDG
ncbi:MAG: hypothetical protein K2N82_05025 [Lachnospiraceae bacterium]|nr:hypothetical protein [Lachnospiraceae bacterium]